MKIKFNLPLINAHCHAAMIAFRGKAEDLPLKIWLEKYIWPMEKKFVSPSFVYKNTKKAILEMKKNGIRVFNDMYFFEREVARAAKEMKIKVVIGEGLTDFPNPGAKNFFEGLKITEELLKKFKNDPYVKVAVAPHSIYTVSTENLILAKKLAKQYKALYHIHLAETKFEFGKCLRKNNTTPVGYLNKLGILDEKTILAHCIWLKDKDIEILAKKKTKVVHCPLSNLKLGSGIAPISKMLEKGVLVSLGTDGPVSSNRLDIWEAGKFAALLQKGITGEPQKLPAKEVIKMMTVNGLKALNIKEIDKKTILDIEKEIKKENFNFLYHLNIQDLITKEGTAVHHFCKI